MGQYLAQGGFRRRRFRREGIQTAVQGPRTAGGPLPRRGQARARQHHSGNHDFAAGRRSGAQTRSDHDASQGGYQQQRRGEIFGRRHLQRGVDGQGRRLRRGLDHDRRDQRQRNQVLRTQVCGNGAPHGTYRIQRHHRAYDDGRADRLPEHSAGYRRKRRTQNHCRGIRETGRPAGNRDQRPCIRQLPESRRVLRSGRQRTRHSVPRSGRLALAPAQFAGDHTAHEHAVGDRRRRTALHHHFDGTHPRRHHHGRRSDRTEGDGKHAGPDGRNARYAGNDPKSPVRIPARNLLQRQRRLHLQRRSCFWTATATRSATTSTAARASRRAPCSSITNC